MKRILILPVLLAIGLVIVPAHAADDEYPIKLFVPAKVGTRRAVQISGKQVLERITLKDGKPDQNTKSVNVVEFKAKVETQAVNAEGQESKRLITIERFVLIPDGDKEQDALPTGFVLTAETKEGRTVYQPVEKDQKLTRLAEHILPRFFANETGATENQMFPIEKPRKVGASWPADKKLLLAQFKGFGIKPEQLTGAAKLVGVKTVNGKKLLELEMTIAVQSEGPSEEDLISQEFSFKMVRRELVPVDYSTGPVEHSSEVSMKHVLKGKPGSAKKDLLLDGRSTDTWTTKTVYLK
ncbi:MAG: hypothetical protein K2R98_30880 [Gemmataceae bacterium]|nr:hypothetical protein [Gemmataceae bacterium]